MKYSYYMAKLKETICAPQPAYEDERSRVLPAGVCHFSGTAPCHCRGAVATAPCTALCCQNKFPRTSLLTPKLHPARLHYTSFYQNRSQVFQTLYSNAQPFFSQFNTLVIATATSGWSLLSRCRSTTTFKVRQLSYTLFLTHVLLTNIFPSLEKVCIITVDGRTLVGNLFSCDHQTNLVCGGPFIILLA